METNIPLQNLVKQNQSLREELMADFIEVIDSGIYVNGSGIKLFENQFAEYVGANHCIGVSSGSAAVELALKSVGIGRGDEVIVPNLTFIASIEGILEVDAVPVLIDIDRTTWNIDSNLIEPAITSKTKAILPVHLHGRLANMEEILPIAKKHNLRVIEDSAQAHGAYRGPNKAGSCSDAAAFSFYPGKNLGAIGEAGGVTTNNKEISDWIQLARNYGSKEKYHHIQRGNNFRLDELQSHFLSTKLKHLDDWIEKRIRAAKLYDSILDSLGIQRTSTDEGRHVYHIYSVLVEQRDKVMSKLNEIGIGASSHYPIPCHSQVGYKSFVKIGSNLKVSEEISSKLLSLPIDESITSEQITYICQELSKIIRNN